MVSVVIVAGTARSPWRLPACLLGGKANDNKNVLYYLGPWVLVRSRTFLTWSMASPLCLPAFSGLHPSSFWGPEDRARLPWSWSPSPGTPGVTSRDTSKIGPIVFSETAVFAPYDVSQEIKGTSCPVGGQGGGCTSVLSISLSATGI